ncbi:hypothetical protein ACIBI9_15940 [Nonomuraea sp. NPDC050451]|uniref:hypothetical protein n=1 Tax=Nonomuraea sp. NPDC050451 TaxID=3364364 RepID=UPI0037AF4196
MPKPLDWPCCEIAVHVADPQPDHMVIRWDPALPHPARVRVRDYTCACKPTFYELCQSGGLYFIRRTRRSGQKVVIDESVWTTHAAILAIWARLLDGTAI